MAYKIEFCPEFERSFKKLKKKDKALAMKVHKKLARILEDPELHKPLRNVLAGFRRVHIGHFVLMYKVKENILIIISIDHHDKAYEK